MARELLVAGLALSRGDAAMPKLREKLQHTGPDAPDSPCAPDWETMFGNLSHIHVESKVRQKSVRQGGVLVAGAELWVEAAQVPKEGWGLLVVYDSRVTRYPRLLAVAPVDLNESRIRTFTSRPAPLKAIRAILLGSEQHLWKWTETQAFNLKGRPETEGPSGTLGDTNGMQPEVV